MFLNAVRGGEREGSEAKKGGKVEEEEEAGKNTKQAESEQTLF